MDANFFRYPRRSTDKVKGNDPCAHIYAWQCVDNVFFSFTLRLSIINRTLTYVNEEAKKKQKDIELS